ncbi:MAG: purine-nucleoside phosphorylase [Gemmataceae bacterium]|nr:purine-nucleoside phosphorylase [Gemmataceae bacterium]
MTGVSYSEFTAAVQALPERPIAFVLGSGLGPVTANMTFRCAVGFADIPGMVAPTVSGHGGQLTLGEWAGRPALVFTGRLHYYEGNPWARVVRPMEVLAELGARAVILTNAAGGINTAFAAGSLMLLTDHLEWNHPRHWLSPGPGTRPSPYSLELGQQLLAAAAVSDVQLHRGVYAAVTGPTYETPAEVLALKACGADAVGMSTAREASRCAELGLPVAAISCVANLAAGLSPTPLSHREVLEAVAASAGRLGRILEQFLVTLPKV